MLTPPACSESVEIVGEPPLDILFVHDLETYRPPCGPEGADPDQRDRWMPPWGPAPFNGCYTREAHTRTIMMTAMQWVVVAYPELPQADYKRIQEIRRQHDRRFAMVEPHFTIVFPTAKLSEQQMLEHVELHGRDIRSFTFMLARAVVAEDIHPTNYQVHLAPTGSIPELTKLHDLLYVDALASELRADLPYSPHITVANSGSISAMHNLAKQINARRLVIRGEITAVTVGSFDGNKMVDVRPFSLT